MVEKQVVIPDISEDLNQYRQLVNADKNPHIDRAIQEELDAVYKDKDGEPRTEKEIAQRLAAYQAGIKARIDQIMGMDPGAFDHRQAKTGEDFESSPRTSLKLFQELFSSPADYQVVTREEIAIGEEADLFWDMVVNPEKISDTTLENMGLEYLLPKYLESMKAGQEGRKKRRLTREVKTELHAEAIGYLKHFFGNCIEPLTLEHEEGKPRAKQVYFRLFRIKEGPHAGMVLGTQMQGNKKILFLSDIASAGRRIDHIFDDSYGKEIAGLRDIGATLSSMIRRVESEDWEEIKSSGAMEEMKAKISGIVKTLQFVENEDKREILRRVARCTTFKDVKDRLNPRSRIEIMRSTIPYVGARIGEIERISGYLSKDRVRVLSYMSGETSRLKEFYDQVDRNTNRLRIVDVNSELDGATTARITTNLRSLISSCEDFKFEPYQTLAQKMIEEINRIIEIINSPDHDDRLKRQKARYAFVKIFSIAKLLNLEESLIGIRQGWFSPGHDPKKLYAKGLMEQLTEIRDRFRSKNIAGDVNMKELSPIYGEIYRVLNEAISTLGQSLSRGKTEENRVEAVKAVDEMLKEFSVAKLLKSPEFQMKLSE